MSEQRFTFDLEKELQNSEREVANPANPANSDPKIRNIRNQPDLTLKVPLGENTHPWTDFYPNLEPADFEISETDHGVHGKKTGGKMAGTVGFLIPWERLEQGPPEKQSEPSTREEWEFSELRLPSQVEPGKVDVWIVGTRLGVPGFRFRFWFVRREGEETGDHPGAPKV